jgi:hypothetical protein
VYEVVVGVVLTAALGGLVVPLVKGILDRRSEQFRSSVALVDSLARSLWKYWKLALRVAYYGRQGPRGATELEAALVRWDSDDAWENGLEIQTQVSQSKRLLPRDAQEKLDEAQQEVVDYLDHEIDHLRVAGTPDQWCVLYESLRTTKRTKIDRLLTDVIADLHLGARRRPPRTGAA